MNRLAIQLNNRLFPSSLPSLFDPLLLYNLEIRLVSKLDQLLQADRG